MRIRRRYYAVFVAWLLALCGFLSLAIRAAHGPVLDIDVSLAKEIQGLPTFSGHLFSFENWLGDTLPLIALTLLVASAFYWRGCVREAGLLLLTFLPRSADLLIKEVVREPRPSPSLIRVEYAPDNLSFPSGHVIGVTLVFTLIAVFAPKLLANRALVLPVQLLSLIAVSTIGLARIWEGAHWPTDALGGYLYALLFLLPGLTWYRLREAGHRLRG